MGKKGKKGRKFRYVTKKEAEKISKRQSRVAKRTQELASYPSHLPTGKFALKPLEECRHLLRKAIENAEMFEEEIIRAQRRLSTEIHQIVVII